MKKDANILKRMTAFIAAICLIMAAPFASVAESTFSHNDLSVLDYLTDRSGKYTGPTVEEKIAKMDTDKNGFADVFEVRAFLVAMHGSDYKKDLLDKWEASASGKSCSTPFAKELYNDKTNSLFKTSQ